MFESVINSLPGVFYEKDKSLKDMNTFRTGGRASLVLYPDSKNSLKKVLSLVRKEEVPYVVLGAGSNVLISDEDFEGVVISTKKLTKMRLWGGILVCECGVKLADAVKIACDNTLGGLEFAVGIPGTVGGFVTMNGGCFNKCAADRVCYVVSEKSVYNNDDCLFDYRKSRFSQGEIVLEAAFRLKVAEEDGIDAKIKRFTQVRRKNQPKGASAGCCFLNEGYFAGKLIDKAGLKGVSVGKATVSKEHGNFIVSDGATSKDIKTLIDIIKKRVFEDCGTELHEEIKYIGKFDDNKV